MITMVCDYIERGREGGWQSGLMVEDEKKQYVVAWSIMDEEVVGKGRVSTSLLMEELHFDNDTEVNCQYVPERILSMTQWRLNVLL